MAQSCFSVQRPDTRGEYCIAKAQQCACCCAKCLFATHNSMQALSCACILKQSLLCPSPAEQAPQQLPIQYTH